MNDIGQVCDLLREIHQTLERMRADQQASSKSLLEAVWEIRGYVLSLDSAVDQVGDQLRFDSQLMESIKSIQGDVADMKPSISRIFHLLEDRPVD